VVDGQYSSEERRRKKKSGRNRNEMSNRNFETKNFQTQKEMKEGGKRAEMEPDRPCRPDRSDQEKKKKVTMQVAGQSKNSTQEKKC
jgi:hypothetical protein